MVVEVINTGTELLLGEILNTNFQYLSKNLNMMGFDVLYQTTVGDNPTRMRKALEIAMERADIIITSGGLGPTRGDITKEVVTELCQTECYLDLDTWGRIDAFFAKLGKKAPENNDKQAYVPIGAEILQNEVGTAPGLWLEHAGKIFILLPGPPFELVQMCEAQLWPRLQQQFPDQGIILSRTLRLRGIGESSVAEKLDDLITTQSNPTLAIYARHGEILVRITAKAANEAEANALIDGSDAQVRERLGDYVYAVDGTSLAEILRQELLKRKQTIAFAESCSGGLASSLVTDVAGSSEYLLGSVVSYTNKIKKAVLGVQKETLQRYGAVSSETACEMAIGVRRLMGADYGVSITGNAGPGGSEGKPVGLVYIAVAMDNAVYCQEHHFSGTRVENKRRIALNAISMTIDKIKAENTTDK